MTTKQTPNAALQAIEQAILELGLAKVPYVDSFIAAADIDGVLKDTAFERGCQMLDIDNEKAQSTKSLMADFEKATKKLPEQTDVNQDAVYQQDNVDFLHFQELRAELTVRLLDTCVRNMQLDKKPALAGILDKQLKIIC